MIQGSGNPRQELYVILLPFMSWDCIYALAC